MKDVQPNDEEKAMKAFLSEYGKLCKKHGFTIVTNPAFTKRDDGTFSVILQTSIGKLPKN